MDKTKERVQVNIPFRMLSEGYQALFLKEGLNPEIGLDAAVLDTVTDRDCAAVADVFHRAGRRITLHGPAVDLSAGSVDSRIRAVTRERFSRLAALAEIFRPAAVVCHGGYEHRRYGYYQAEWLDIATETWTGLATSLNAAGCRLLLENVYETRPEELAMQVQPLSGLGVGCCLDTGHQNAFGDGRIAHWVAVLGPFIGEVHLHDNFGDGDEHLPPGRGGIDFSSLLAFLKTRTESPPIITLEPHREADLAPALAFVAQHLPASPNPS